MKMKIAAATFAALMLSGIAQAESLFPEFDGNRKDHGRDDDQQARRLHELATQQQ